MEGSKRQGGWGSSRQSGWTSGLDVTWEKMGALRRCPEGIILELPRSLETRCHQSRDSKPANWIHASTHPLSWWTLLFLRSTPFSGFLRPFRRMGAKVFDPHYLKVCIQLSNLFWVVWNSRLESISPQHFEGMLHCSPPPLTLPVLLFFGPRHLKPASSLLVP